MKLIHKFKSPNFNKRKINKILFIIIHYTALKNYNEAINYLCKPANKVSAHYLISQNGDIYNLVSEKNRAWHAGISFWNGTTDINSVSIGIELDFSYNVKNNKFSKKMINSLVNLIKVLKKKYNIEQDHILGHSDIAPLRKKDPGPDFPWNKIYSKDYIENFYDRNYLIIEKLNSWFKKNGINSKKKIAYFILSFIGYDFILAKKNNYYFSKIISIYQARTIRQNITGKVDELTLKFMINHLLNYLLTKNKKKL